MSTNAVKTLRREVNRAKGVEAGTVVTFDRTIGIRVEDDVLTRRWHTEDRTFSYAAIFVGGRWFFTGKGTLGNSALTNREFLDRMAEADITNLRVVTSTEEV